MRNVPPCAWDYSSEPQHDNQILTLKRMLKQMRLIHSRLKNLNCVTYPLLWETLHLLQVQRAVSYVYIKKLES